MSTKDKLIEAAIKLFEEKGYSGTTTAAIAASAGVADVTLFRHFGSKEVIFKEALKKIQNSGELELFEDNKQLDYMGTILYASRKLCKYFIKENRTIRMMLFESIRNPLLCNFLTEGPMKNIKYLSRYFSSLISDGILKSGDPKVYAESLVSLVFGYTIGLASLRDEDKIEESLNQLDKMISDFFIPGIENKGRDK